MAGIGLAELGLARKLVPPAPVAAEASNEEARPGRVGSSRSVRFRSGFEANRRGPLSCDAAGGCPHFLAFGPCREWAGFG